MTPSCPATGLRCYRSARAAKAAHRTLGNRLRAFHCAACACWHITHAEQEGKKR
jgi:hypothetical protein